MTLKVTYHGKLIETDEENYLFVEEFSVCHQRMYIRSVHKVLFEQIFAVCILFLSKHLFIIQQIVVGFKLGESLHVVESSDQGFCAHLL